MQAATPKPKTSGKSFPSPLSILMIVIVLAALSTWLLPAGEYRKLSLEGTSFRLSGPEGEQALPLTQHTLDSLGIRIPLEKFTGGDIRKPVSVPGSYTRQPRNAQGLVAIVQAPLKGMYDSVDIILFVLIIGGFMYVFNETGAMVKGINRLAHVMRGRESRLIITLTFLLSFFAGSYGMAEEALVFYPIIVPLFLAAGYDLLVPLAIIFGGTMIGGMPSFSNPFATIIASNAAGINWQDGLAQRLLVWAASTSLMTWYILRYAARVKRNPAASLVAQIDGNVQPPFDCRLDMSEKPPPLDNRTVLLILLYGGTFLLMIAGVVFLKWWTLEMSALFLGSAVLVALIHRIPEKEWIREFLRGAESLLMVAFIIGVARGVTVVLNEGKISDSILYYAAGMVQGMPPALFLVLLLLFYVVFSLFIQSTSGMAVLTMPIMGALAVLVHLPGKEIVNAYMYGMSIMAFLAPTGLLLPSLAMVNVSVKTWFRFIIPFIWMVTGLCILALLAGLYL